MSSSAQLVSQCHSCAGTSIRNAATSGEVAECIQCGVVFLVPLQSQFAHSATDQSLRAGGEQFEPDARAADELAAESRTVWKLTGLASVASLVMNGTVLILLAMIFFHDELTESPFEFSGQFSLVETEEFEIVADFEAGGQTAAEDRLSQAEQLLAPSLFSDVSAAESEVRLATGQGSGSGKGSGNSTGNGAGMFTTSKSANSFAYVVDASGSMRGSRMQRVLRELNRSINGLDPHQQFFVVFFSNKPFPMMWPNIERRLVSATDTNRQRILQWAFTVEPDGGTEPQGALQQALALQPDVVFFLTDGAIPEETDRVVRRHRKHPTIVNAICIGQSAETRMMKEIAESGGGDLVVVK